MYTTHMCIQLLYTMHFRWKWYWPNYYQSIQ